MQVLSEPVIDSWYRDASARTFQVVAVDNDEGSVEIQYFSGEVEEIALGAWYGMQLEAIDPPEDWTGPFDDLGRDDLGDTEQVTRPEDWSGPWEEIEREG
jgi:hypothetical protein